MLEKDVEEIVHKVINTDLSTTPTVVETGTNTLTESNGIYVNEVDHTILSPSDQLQKCDVTLLMDSNRKCIGKSSSFHVSIFTLLHVVQFSLLVLLQPKFHCQHTTIIHFGGNNMVNLTLFRLGGAKLPSKCFF